MGKKAVILISLVEESAEKSNEEIEKEILEELSKHPSTTRLHATWILIPNELNC